MSVNVCEPVPNVTVPVEPAKTRELLIVKLVPAPANCLFAPDIVNVLLSPTAEIVTLFVSTVKFLLKVAVPVPARVTESLTVNVLPSKIVKVADVVGAVIVSLFTVPAVKVVVSNSDEIGTV